MQAPNIPLRAGPSGPLVDWLYWLRNLTYFAGFKRIWTAEQTGSPVDVPTPTAMPGLEVLHQDVDWTADDYAIAGQLHYLVLARLVFNTSPPPLAYPGQLRANLNVTPAGGVLSTVHTWYTWATPIDPPASFSVGGDTFGTWFMQFGKFPALAVGANRFALALANPAAGNGVYVQNAELSIAELACPPGMLSTP